MITLIDTIENNGLTYEDYIEFCEDNDMTPYCEDSSEFYEWARETAMYDWDDFLDGLKYNRKSHIPCKVDGTLGLWNCHPSVGETFRTLRDAILACAGDCADIKVCYDKGLIRVTGYHHDGTNTFSIRQADGKFIPLSVFD